MKQRHLRLTARLTLVLLSLALAGATRAGTNSSDIASETSRTVEEPQHVVNFWWLPPEYFVQAAKELDYKPEDQEKVARVYRDYVIIAALDADLTNKKNAVFAPIADVVKRAKFTRDGKTLEVLRELNPEVADSAPTLMYLLRNSLGRLGEGLRLLPLSNLDAKGNPIFTASTPGELTLEYKIQENGPVHDVRWHAPLTAVAGARKCPKGGEPLEASWNFCPWHGVKLVPLKP
jgi:hypothetical protein